MPATKSAPACRFCQGRGHWHDDTPCSACNPTAADTTYLATSGTDLIETGGRLYSFVRELMARWAELDAGHVAVWAVGGDRRRPELVAVVHAAPGGPSVRWI